MKHSNLFQTLELNPFKLTWFYSCFLSLSLILYFKKETNSRGQGFFYCPPKTFTVFNIISIN